MNRTLVISASLSLFALVGCTVATVPADAPAAGDQPLGAARGRADKTDDAGASDPSDPSDKPTTDPTSEKPTGGCTFGEPNDDRDHATKVSLGKSYTACTSGEDDDFYEFTTPADEAGGLVEVEFTNMKGGLIEAELFTASDNASLGKTYETTSGADHRIFLGAAPNVKFRLRVGAWSSSAGLPYDMKLTYTKTADTFEPNDTREQAKPLALGKTVEGTIAPKSGTPATNEESSSDWFAVDLAAGSVEVTLENVSTSLSGKLELYNGGGSKLTYEYEATRGANVTLKFAVSAGKHYVRVIPWTGALSFDEGPTPDHFSRKYKLTVKE